MGIDFKRPRHIKGFKFGEVLVWDFSSKPLVEKTVSGSVVTFSDGADDVPLKSCAVTIAPTLSGVSSVDVVSAGRNLLEIDSSYDNSTRATTLTRDYSNNVLHIYGKIQDTNSNYYSQDITDLVREMGTVTIIANTVSGGTADLSFRVNIQNGSTVISRLAIGDTARTITYTDGYTYLLMFFVSISATVGNTVDMTVNFEANYGSSVGAYTPYVTPTTYTANLGRTIYGGSVDVANGNCEPTNIVDIPGNLTSGTSGGLTYSASSDGAISYSGTAGAFSYMTPELDFTIKSGQTFTFSRNTAFSYIHRIRLTFSDDTTTNVSIAANNTSVTYTPDKDIKAIRFIVAGLTTGASYSDTVYLQLQYGDTATAYSQYFTPFTFTPVPIISRLGDNTMWSDGDLSVTYYANAN